jgi:Domain of unknown function
VDDEWRVEPSAVGKHVPSCRPASSRSAAFCQEKMRSRPSKKAIQDTYGKRGDAVVQKNYSAVDQTLAHLSEVKVPSMVSAGFDMLPAVSPQAPQFVRNVLGTIITGNGDSLPVSAMPVDGSFPAGTAMWEKRNIAKEIPVWDESICIQCGKCVWAARCHSGQSIRLILATECAGNIQVFQATLAEV